MTNNYPNLFIPGAAKSGTSTLHDLLNEHPEICMSSIKEPYYLINTDFDANISTYNTKYAELFKAQPDAQFKGDSSTAYMLFPYFIDRVKTHIKHESKFIFVLRNPIDRIYSHYWYLKGLGSEDLSLHDAIQKDKDIEPNMSQRLSEGKFKNYFQYGLYGKWLSKFYEEFNANQIKIIVFEDLKTNPLKIANDCFSFLGLNPLDTITERESNKTEILRYPKFYKTILRITNGKVKILKPLNTLIPKRIKNKLKHSVPELIVNHTKTNTSYPKLSDDDRLWIKALYLDDFNVLKKVTGQDFKQWTDFK